MNSTNDKINGAANTVAGSVKKVVGDLTGDDALKAEGVAQTIKGEVQKTSGSAKDMLRQGLHAAGDLMESAGKKLEEAGMKTLGEAVHKAGDKVEHLAD